VATVPGAIDLPALSAAFDTASASFPSTRVSSLADIQAHDFTGQLLRMRWPLDCPEGRVRATLSS
jgi:hypothetical protein